jgi:hypothetical protein
VPSVRELNAWECLRCGCVGRYDDPRAVFTLTRVDENGKERVLFPYEREEVQHQRLAGRSIRQLGWLGYGLGVMCGDCANGQTP